MPSSCQPKASLLTASTTKLPREHCCADGIETSSHIAKSWPLISKMAWSPGTFMKAHLLAGILLILTGFCPVGAFVVPNTNETTEGNSANLFPFLYSETGNVSGRYQQLYDRSQFTGIPQSGAWITGIYLRSDAQSEQPISVDLKSAQIEFSTTQRTVSSLSPVFSENVGPNNTVVFPAARLRSVRDADGYIHLSFNTGFWYSPASGNLLMDVRILVNEQNPSANFVAFDAVTGSPVTSHTFGNIAGWRGSRHWFHVHSRAIDIGAWDPFNHRLRVFSEGPQKLI
jgi:hypothetical protein